MIDQESSLRLKLLRFPPIIGVIYIHAYGTVISFGGGTVGSAHSNGLTDFIRILISEGLARMAVPLFFLISGYLFFANFRWSHQTYGKKILTRLRTLLIPYLFWNLLVLAIVALGQAIPMAQPYFSDHLVAEYTGYEYLNVILGLKGYPIAYHFWFIRDLMLLVLLAPVIAVILRFAALPFFIAVYICWVSDTWPIYAPAAVGVFFFSAGALCGIKGQSLFAFDRFGAVALCAYLPILLADVYWYSAWFNVYLHRTGLIVGLVAALYSTRWIARQERLKNVLVTLGGASFFVYAAHEPMLGIVRTLAFKYIPLGWPYTMLLLYLAIPVLVMAVLVLCHRMLIVLCPRALSVVTGGR